MRLPEREIKQEALKDLKLLFITQNHTELRTKQQTRLNTPSQKASKEKL